MLIHYLDNFPELFAHFVFMFNFVCYPAEQSLNVNPIQTGGGGGRLWRPYQTLKLNNFKAVRAMTTKFSDFS